MNKTFTAVLLRHGESQWNKENRFTGWTDVDISEMGASQAGAAGRVLAADGFVFDAAFTSFLKRAQHTLDIALSEMGLAIPVIKSWRLNERHYGALEGLNKAETARKYGDEQVHLWRRSYDVRPPAVDRSDPRFPGNSPLYKGIPAEELPVGESLKDTAARVIPYWESEIAPQVRSGRRLLVSAHGNTIRALVQYFDGLDNEAVSCLNIPTGIPLVYHFDADMHSVKHFYVGDVSEVKNALECLDRQLKQG